MTPGPKHTGRLQAYLDHVVTSPGRQIRLFAHAETRTRARLGIVRLLGPSDEPGLRDHRSARPVSWVGERRVTIDPQRTTPGSYLRAPIELPGSPKALTVHLGMLLTSRSHLSQALLDLPGWLTVTARRAPDAAAFHLTVERTPGEILLATTASFRRAVWYELTLTWSDETRELGLTWRPHDHWGFEPPGFAKAASRPPTGVVTEAIFGARLDADGHACAPLEGRVDFPALWSCILDAGQLDQLTAGRWPSHVARASCLGAWHFGMEARSTHVPNLARPDLPGRVVNRPARAITSRTWSASTPPFVEGSRAYSAAHFHTDDLDDAAWEETCTFTVPSELASGVYAVTLHSSAGDEHTPFVVLPVRARASVAVVLPTLTYLAYANMHFDDDFVNLQQTVSSGRAIKLSEREDVVTAFPAFGKSLYDVHDDGSPVYFSSWRRPIQELHADYRNGLLDAPRHLSADLALLGWLDDEGVAVDVLTDEVLDEQGPAALTPYRVVLTGGHPEYQTARILDAYEGYVRGRGRLMYMGGNGFYWVAARSPDGIALEVRRGLLGPRVRAAQPGEQMTSTGAIGGLWRHRGRSPQRLVGVGFAGLGWVDACGYRRTAAATDPRYAFVLEGVDHDPFGTGGWLGGAAGDEIDRYDERLGSPPQTVVIATSAGEQSEYYQPALEDEEQAAPNRDARHNRDVRADMTITAHPSGGAVFTTGSLAWILGLCARHRDPAVARITLNVLRRFLNQAPIV